MSFTAIHEVYSQLWDPSLSETQYASRTHFIDKLTVALLAWSCLKMLRDSGVPQASFQWMLRPHHESSDFATLLLLVREAFDRQASRHDCWLFRQVPVVVIDNSDAYLQRTQYWLRVVG